METDWLWNCFSATGNIELYIAWKEQKQIEENQEKNGSHQSSGDRDRGSFHG